MMPRLAKTETNVQAHTTELIADSFILQMCVDEGSRRFKPFPAHVGLLAGPLPRWHEGSQEKQSWKLLHLQSPQVQSVRLQPCNGAAALRDVDSATEGGSCASAVGTACGAASGSDLWAPAYADAFAVESPLAAAFS